MGGVDVQDMTVINERVIEEGRVSPFLFSCIFVGIVAAYILSVYGLTSTYDLPFNPFNSFYSLSLSLGTGVFLFYFLCFRIVRVVFSKPDGNLWLAIASDIKGYLTVRRIAVAAPILMMMPLFFSAFTMMKNSIPVLVPFYLDPWLAEADRVLHFGIEPWRWLDSVLGSAFMAMAISFFYKIWFMIKYGMVCWQAFRLDAGREREQFLLALLLCWIVIGTFMALLLSSAGPCYFGLVYPDLVDPYAELMHKLQDANKVFPVFDLVAQDYLWKSYDGHYAVPFSGISAMPSMHLSMATLFLLGVWHMGAFWRWLFGVYLVLILAGSVYLGWHYALDGYVAILVTLVLWQISGFITRKLAIAPTPCARSNAME
ncbi:phosphatase PAP2 family protein [Alcanivorax sp. S6407]|uniref:phosphatase PAP2 family protein n=1 Tax=Alcanivorax sp. S6407 TaxID=2926424 RepID=UPI001FF1FB58|nr:phosphatase PAP2 family protein [Alcanivorax sp. S6407]MCK0154653.1 phosphatase PAP2 family protein [Alcanivorax sp. S6407]